MLFMITHSPKIDGSLTSKQWKVNYCIYNSEIKILLLVGIVMRAGANANVVHGKTSTYR